MKTLSFKSCALLLAVLCCASCGDDPKLVEKRDQQRAEIARLKGEIALIEEKLKNMPPDVTAELDATRKRAEEQTTEVAKLESEVAELEARKRAMQAEFDSYRAKYQLK
jgi:septal ring factor EnvC (AmiA/AmiB activator)